MSNKHVIGSALVIVLSLAPMFFMTGCALTDGLGLTRPQRDDNGQIQYGDDGEPLRETGPLLDTLTTLGGIFGPAVGIGVQVLTAGTSIALAFKNKSKKAEIARGEIISAGSMKIIDLLLAEINRVASTLDLDENHDGHITAEELKKLPEKAWDIVKSRADEYKAMLSDPSEWEYILRHVNEILSPAAGKKKL